MEKLRIVGVGTRDSKSMNEGQIPHFSGVHVQVSTIRLQSCRGKSAGVAKRPRESDLPPDTPNVRFATFFIAVWGWVLRWVTVRATKHTKPKRGAKLNVGYLSSDFGNSPVGRLMASVPLLHSHAAAVAPAVYALNAHDRTYYRELVEQVKDSPGDAKSSLGDAESSLGDAKSSLGDAKSSLGDAKSSLGDAKSSLGDTKSSLGDAKSSLGDAKSSMVT